MNFPPYYFHCSCNVTDITNKWDAYTTHDWEIMIDNESDFAECMRRMRLELRRKKLESCRTDVSNYGTITKEKVSQILASTVKKMVYC